MCFCVVFFADSHCRRDYHECRSGRHCDLASRGRDLRLRREDNGASRFFSTARARNGRRRREIRLGPHVSRDSRRPASRLLLRAGRTRTTPPRGRDRGGLMGRREEEERRGKGRKRGGIMEEEKEGRGIRGGEGEKNKRAIGRERRGKREKRKRERRIEEGKII